jgi:hypothetical protein
MATPKNWNEVAAAVMKILGNKGKIPEHGMGKQVDDHSKAHDEFNKAVSGFEDLILAVQKTTLAFTNAVKQYRDRLAKSDFGLDGKNPDEKKKIAQARGVMIAYIELLMSQADTSTKGLDELGKLAMAIAKRGV